MTTWCVACLAEHLGEHVDKTNHVNATLQSKGLPELPPQLELLRLLVTAPTFQARTKRCRHKR